MVEVFVPSGYCSKTFWVQDQIKNVPDTKLDPTFKPNQPFSVYHLDQPHLIRLKYDHLGASPLSRANANKSMQLLRRILQPAINQDIVDLFRKYISVFREAAENACENMLREPFRTSSTNLDIELMVSEVCQEALTCAISLFDAKNKSPQKSKINENTALPSKLSHPGANHSNIPSHVLPGKRRAASPDFPWQKRLKDGLQDVAMRRSLSPVPKKRLKALTPVVPPRRYGSPHRNTKETVRRKIENWDPSRLTTETKFVMGTKANRALGLGATRGRIYMKHPDLFKYAGDHDDKKWMVKNNCMAATGGKNTFLMIADDVLHLFETEYKDSPGVLPEELQFFKLPEFVLEKMRAAMIHEKNLRVGKPSSVRIVSDVIAPSHDEGGKYSTNRGVRQAAQAAAVAINAASTASEENDSLLKRRHSPAVAVTTGNESNQSDIESEISDSED